MYYSITPYSSWEALSSRVFDGGIHKDCGYAPIKVAEALAPPAPPHGYLRTKSKDASATRGGDRLAKIVSEEFTRCSYPLLKAEQALTEKNPRHGIGVKSTCKYYVLQSVCNMVCMQSCL